MAITDWPLNERPREKLLGKGAESLSDAELVAIFLRTGLKGKSAVDLAREVLSAFGSLSALCAADSARFCGIPGLGSAKYVEFTTHYDPAIMMRRPVLRWPYTEGLRLDEALHPLTLLALGLYGEPLPAQNGAPVRVVVPWKYGFKSAKSVVRIRLVEQQPATAWNIAAPQEYGFYSNVNPDVSHPRWSQGAGFRGPRVV